MDQREVVDKLLKYKVLVSKHFNVEKLVLYGSYAKGTQNEDSDIDVAIIVKSIGSDYFTYAPLLWKLRREIDFRIEPILIESSHDESGFLKEVLDYGLVI